MTGKFDFFFDDKLKEQEDFLGYMDQFLPDLKEAIPGFVGEFRGNGFREWVFAKALFQIVILKTGLPHDFHLVCKELAITWPTVEKTSRDFYLSELDFIAQFESSEAEAELPRFVASASVKMKEELNLKLRQMITPLPNLTEDGYRIFFILSEELFYYSLCGIDPQFSELNSWEQLIESKNFFNDYKVCSTFFSYLYKIHAEFDFLSFEDN